ncbi:amidohydrolase [Roseovarius aestuarii]|nr:amidohydrolase [Roseovarius aestuarii]
MHYSNLRDSKGAVIGLRCQDGWIADIGAHLSSGGDMDGEGRLLMPAFTEPHCHLDKTLWGEPWHAPGAGPELRDYIENERRVLSACKTPIAERAGRMISQMLAYGTTAIRSHVDIAPDMGLSHVEAMIELKAAWADRIDLQLVAFPQQGFLTKPGTQALVREAMQLGVDVVGGLDPAGIDGDPEGQLSAIFELATEFDRDVDIHLHDPDQLGAWQIARIADFTEEANWGGRVMVSHGYCLGAIPDKQLDRIGRRLADLSISVMTTAPADTTVPPIARLTDLGVNMCCGSDGIRDAWSPFGNGDLLERAFLAAYRFDWNSDPEFALALDCTTVNAARAIGRDARGLVAGAQADFIMIDAQSPGDALCRRPGARRVVRAGRIVADDGRLLV